jgi:hypothetical protein
MPKTYSALAAIEEFWWYVYSQIVRVQLIYYRVNVIRRMIMILDLNRLRNSQRLKGTP